MQHLTPIEKIDPATAAVPYLFETIFFLLFILLVFTTLSLKTQWLMFKTAKNENRKTKERTPETLLAKLADKENEDKTEVEEKPILENSEMPVKTANSKPKKRSKNRPQGATRVVKKEEPGLKPFEPRSKLVRWEDYDTHPYLNKKRANRLAKERKKRNKDVGTSALIPTI